MLSDATQFLARIGFFSSTSGVHIVALMDHGSTYVSEVSGICESYAHELMDCAWLDRSGERERGFCMQ